MIMTEDLCGNKGPVFMGQTGKETELNRTERRGLAGGVQVREKSWKLCK